MSLIDDIKISSLAEAQDIIKGIGTEDIFEKAHKDGDLHPNGKWVWVSSAAGGKGDWRTLNGRTHKKHAAANASGSGAGSGAGSKAAAGNSSNAGSGKNSSAAKPATTVTKKTATEMKKESGKVSDVEFKRIVSRLKSDPDNRDASRYLEEEEMSDAELQNFLDYANKFKIDSANLNKMTRDRCAKWAKLALEEKADRDKAKKKVVAKNNLSDAFIEECSKDINQSLKEVTNIGYSSFDKEINFNGKKQTIYVKLWRRDDINRKKSYEISVGTEFGNIEKISENTYISSSDIKSAIKSYFKDKQSPTKSTKKTTTKVEVSAAKKKTSSTNLKSPSKVYKKISAKNSDELYKKILSYQGGRISAKTTNSGVLEGVIRSCSKTKDGKIVLNIKKDDGGIALLTTSIKGSAKYQAPQPNASKIKEIKNGNKKVEISSASGATDWGTVNYLINSGMEIQYRHGLSFRSGSNSSKKISAEEALEKINKNTTFDASVEDGILHINTYGGFDMD